MKIVLVNILILGTAAFLIYFFVKSSQVKSYPPPTHAELVRYDKFVFRETKSDLQHYASDNKRHAKGYAAFSARLIRKEQAFYRTHGIYTVHLLADLSLYQASVFDDTMEIKDISTDRKKLIVALTPAYSEASSTYYDYGCQRMNFDADMRRCEELIYKFPDNTSTIKPHNLTLDNGKILFH